MSEMWINLYIDGAPCAVKVARTVWDGGKVGDHFKDLPIVTDLSKANYNAFQFREHHETASAALRSEIQSIRKMHHSPVKVEGLTGS